MDCRRVRDLLFEAVDSDLPEAVREELEAHLVRCRFCAAEAAAVEAELEALRALPRAGVPADFLQRIHARMNEPQDLGGAGKRFSGLFGGRRFIEAAGLAVAAMLVVVIHHAFLKERPQVKPFVSEQAAPVSKAKPELEPSAPPAEPAMTREEVGRPAAEFQQPQSPPVPAGVSRGSAAPGELSLTLTLKPSPPGTANLMDGKAAAPPFHRDSEQKALRAAPSARPVGEGLDGGAEVETRKGGEIKFRRGEEGAPSGADAVREKAAMHHAPKPGPGGRIHGAMEEIKRIVAEAGGVVLSTAPRGAMDLGEAMVVAEVPPEQLPALLDHLRLLGETRSEHGASAAGEPGAKIRLSLKVIIPEP